MKISAASSFINKCFLYLHTFPKDAETFSARTIYFLDTSNLLNHVIYIYIFKKRRIV